jgi:prepilin-type N-terminal cleavage/methylation domain-containing protein
MNVYRRGFTLVELLVVIAIIGALCSLLFGVLGPVRESARTSNCIGNLRQIGVAIRLYMDDYGDDEPATGNPSSAAALGLPTLGSVHDFFRDYVKSTAVARCPSYHGQIPVDRVTTTYTWAVLGESAKVPKSSRYSSIVARRGGDSPVAICESHNARWDRTNEPRWTLKSVVVLRLNLSVKQRRVPLDEPPVNW